MRHVSRRQSLVWFGAAGAVGAFGSTALGQLVVKEIHELKPGEFTWHPERSPVGPVAIIVSIPDQRVHVYRNGIRIAVSTCSTGKAGHSTPTGVFTILEKDKNHHSSTYNNAPMPNMNRLTWSGVALHAGNLPGYPASHGCIRLPLQFSELLFSVTHVGTPVILAGSHGEPKEVVHPGMVLSDYAEHEYETVKKHVKAKANPWQAEVVSYSGVTSVLVSRADSSITIFEDGEIAAEGRAVIADPGTPLGFHVFMLADTHDARKGLVWHAVGHHGAEGQQLGDSDTRVLQRIGAEPKVLDQMRPRMHAGMVLITTDLPAHPDTRSGRDFVVMSQEMS